MTEHHDRRAPSDLESIACEAAHKAVAQTFALLGVNINSQADINALRIVLLHAGKVQRLSERAGLIALLTITGAVISGALTFLWAGLVETIKR